MVLLIMRDGRTSRKDRCHAACRTQLDFDEASAPASDADNSERIANLHLDSVVSWGKPARPGVGDVESRPIASSVGMPTLSKKARKDCLDLCRTNISIGE